MLAHPDYEKTFHVFTDASNIAVGAVLMQRDKKIKIYDPLPSFQNYLIRLKNGIVPLKRNY